MRIGLVGSCVQRGIGALAVGLCMLGLAGCGSQPAQEASAASAGSVTVADLAHHRWVLTSINGEPPLTNPLGTYDKGLVPDLDFGEAPHVGGWAGCNRYKGQFELNDEGQFRIPQVATTMKMCAQDAMAFEQRYTAVLGQWHQLRIVGNELSLSSGDEVWLFKLQDWVQ